MRDNRDVQFGILGPLTVRAADGREVAVGGLRPRALLALLLLDAGRTVSVERLIDGQYGDDPPAGAANAVQAQVSRLRRALPDRLIEFHGAGYRLAVEREDVDAHRFERLAREGRRLLAAGLSAQAAAVLGDALELWRGPALADVLDAPLAAAQARRLEELRLSAREDLLAAELALPEASPVGALRELVAAHPLRERARGLLMRALHAAGRQAEALAVYDETRRLLADELGADPSAELAALHLEILRGSAAGPAAVARTRPPTPFTSFVGREDELARIRSLAEARLVTIVGPGGTGKTRLAVEATTDGRREVCFVDLSLVDGDSGGQVAAAVLGALGLREPALRAPEAGGAGDAAGRVVAALSEQELTLVLDNCEHVVAGAAALARRLLTSCPRLTVLATSREPLNITGEHLVPLAPLPDPLAVRLFADRASAVRQGFALGPDNLDAVRGICAALDGLPLAIELAAARTRTFGVAEIAARLAEHGRFALLSRGDRTAAARHRTLHGVVEWSWSLLAEEEQELARRFAVFAGGARLEAVEAVCGADAAEPLAGLVDKSFVETDGERYQMLETIRLFCAGRLAEAGEEERLRRAHAAWFLELARRADDHLYRAEQLDWLARLSADDANLRAALRWSVEHDPATAARLVAALAMYWWLSGRRGQAIAPATRLLDTLGAEPPAELAEEYVLTVLHAVPDAGSPHWERARAAAGSLGRPMRCRLGPALWGMVAGPPDDDGGEHWPPLLSADPWSRALGRLSEALILVLRGRIGAAERELESVLTDFGAVGERWGKAQALDWLALITSWRGDRARAMHLWQDAVGLLEELGAAEELVDVLCRRAEARCRADDPGGARADCERAAELTRRTGRPALMATIHLVVAEITRIEHTHLPPKEDGVAWVGEVAERLDAALEIVQGSWAFTASGIRSQVLTALARLAEARGDAAEAARRHGEALAAALGSPMTADLAAVAEGLAGHALLPAQENTAQETTAQQTTAEDAARAGLLLGVGAALRGIAVAGDPDVAATAARASAVLGPDGFAAAYAKGAAMGRAEAREALTAQHPG
ncbi:BTAD domain-containing putative transcriptional regulator [Nonomuraea bangladeshensis]|uniref:BTAD domain-containing putative transcriptional regulator n=1 Tax=Nonomuraea bangladeshensis TaxID=404385 RepID=UPI0031CEFE65